MTDPTSAKLDKSNWKTEWFVVISRLRALIVILLLVNISVTSFCITNMSENKIKNAFTSIIVSQPSYEYPPFVPPPSNTSTIDNGSVWVDGMYLYWRLFSPNSSIQYQNPRFQIAFDIWWEHTPGGHIVTLGVVELDGGSFYYDHYGTLTNHTILVNDTEGNFLHYGIWSNSSYFYMNMTNSLWVPNIIVHSATVKLALSVQAATSHGLFSYNILRDIEGPTPNIIHTNYNESTNELFLDWNSTDFHINVTDNNDIVYSRVSAQFTNRRTGLHEEIRFWESYDIQNNQLIEISLQENLLEAFIVNASRTLENPLNIDMEILLIDEFLNSNSFLFKVYINRSDLMTTTTTTIADLWQSIVPIIGVGSIIGAAMILLFIYKFKRP